MMIFWKTKTYFIFINIIIIIIIIIIKEMIKNMQICSSFSHKPVLL